MRVKTMLSKPKFPGQSHEDSFFFDSNFILLRVFLGFFFLMLVSRIWYLQIIRGEDFRQFSQKNLLKESDIYAARGKIYDRNGKILVENLPAYKVTITPQYTTDLEGVAQSLGKILKTNPQVIIEKVKKSHVKNGRFFPVDIKLYLTRDELFNIEMIKMDHPGLETQEFILRHYPYKEEIAHILGYVSEISKEELPVLRKKRNIHFKPGDIIGKNGLEESFDTHLRGEKGKTFVVVDAKGQKRPSRSISAIGEMKTEVAISGVDIYTTLDLDIQKVSYSTFKKHNRVGSLVAMTPQGEILSWVSYPPFDPNVFSTRMKPSVWKAWTQNPDRPLTNKVIQDHYSPGSTFKPIVALAALQKGKIKPEQTIDAPSKIFFGGRFWHDHSQYSYGKIDIEEALERSSNTFFFKMGRALGPDNIALYATALGLGQKTLVPVQGEVAGRIPTALWKKERFGEPWQKGESLNTAIGQGHVLTTTLQLAQAYSAIALDGDVYQPQIIKKIQSDSNQLIENFQPQLLRSLSKDKEADYFVNKEHLDVVKKGLWRVVNGKKGTAQSARLLAPFSISGKTGTAQVRRFAADQIYQPCKNREKKDKHNGWFVGYGSKEKTPLITVAVFTEHSCTSAAAVPLAKEVIHAYFKKYYGMKN